MNWRQTKSGTSSKYDTDHLINHDDYDDDDDYNNGNDGIKGGRNDDHENVKRNSETSQKFFGTGLLI